MQTVWIGESCLSSIQFNIVYPPVLYHSTFPILTLLTGIILLCSSDDPKDGITTFLRDVSDILPINICLIYWKIKKAP
jgi:hypothetical protein